MVVTNRFLDGARDEARRYLAEKADFLGAVRLPNNAFSKNANTEVTTDIVFLRRKVPGEAFIAPQDWNDMTLRERANWVKAAGGGDLPDTDQRLGTDWEKLPSDNQARLLKARAVQNAGHDWLDVVEHTDKNGAKVPLNEYFHEHPEMMLGDFGAYGTMYRPDDPALVAREGQDTAALLDAAIEKLPKDIVISKSAPVEQETIPVKADLTNVRIGSMFKEGDHILVREEDELGEKRASRTELTGKAFERASGMIDLRDSFADVRRLQLDPAGMGKSDAESGLALARAKLNEVYDKFVKEHGYVNSDANTRIFRDDPSPVS